MQSLLVLPRDTVIVTAIRYLARFKHGVWIPSPQDRSSTAIVLRRYSALQWVHSNQICMTVQKILCVLGSPHTSATAAHGNHRVSRANAYA